MNTVKDLDFITAIANFVVLRVSSAVKKELKQKPQLKKRILNHLVVPRQLLQASRQTKTPKPDAFVASVALVMFENTKIGRKSRVKSAGESTCYRQSPLQIVFWKPVQTNL